MKNISDGAATGLLIALLVGVAGCSAEQVAVGTTPPREQEIVRLRTKNPLSAPVVMGQVKVWDPTGLYPLPSALVEVDDNLVHTDELGRYQLTVAPGTHRVTSGQVGIQQSRVTVKVAQGDSVRVNFRLRPDQRPQD